MKDKAIKERIKELVEQYQMSFIPLRFMPSKNNPKDKNGKVPAISNWNKYEKELPTDEEIDAWEIRGEMSGLGVVTGIASNLGCIDVDTEDELIKKAIDEIIPLNAAIVQGNPKRGGKYLFKLTDGFNDVPEILGKKVLTKVDIFAGGGQIALPHGIHTKYSNGATLNYEWKRGVDAEKFPIVDELPLLTMNMVTNIQGIVSGTPLELRNKNTPDTVDKTGRWASTAAEVSRVVRERIFIR